MAEIIQVTISENHVFGCTTRVIARSGENMVARFEIKIPNEFSDWWPYLEFEKPNGKIYKTQKLEIGSDIIIYDIPKAVLDVAGELGVQLVMEKESGENWKSDKKQFYVRKSVDATDEIPYEDETKTSAILTDISTGIRYKLYVENGKLTMEEVAD